jgi:hypothetical protein
MEVVTTPRKLYFQTKSPPPLHQVDRKLDGFKACLDAEVKETIFVLPGIELHSSRSHSSHCDSHYPQMLQNTHPLCLRSRARDAYAAYCTLSTALFWVNTSGRNYHYSLNVGKKLPLLAQRR